MADETVTIAEVLASTGGSARRLTKIAAVAITPGQAITENTSGQMVLADASDAALRNVSGIAENEALAGQPISYVERDPEFDPGFAINEGEPIYLSATVAGNVTKALVDVNSSGEAPVLLGMGVGGGKASINCRSGQLLISDEVA